MIVEPRNFLFESFDLIFNIRSSIYFLRNLAHLMRSQTIFRSKCLMFIKPQILDGWLYEQKSVESPKCFKKLIKQWDGPVGDSIEYSFLLLIVMPCIPVVFDITSCLVLC